VSEEVLREWPDGSDLFFHFFIVPYRSDARTRMFAPPCKDGAEAGFWLRNVVGN